MARRLRGAADILRLSPARARQLVAIMQRELVQHDAWWARCGDPAKFDAFDRRMAKAKAIESDVLAAKGKTQ